MATAKKVIKKAQVGIKATADSTKYYQDDAKLKLDVAQTQSKFGLKKASEQSAKEARESLVSASRQKLKGKPGYDANGFPIKKNKTSGVTNAKDGKWIQKATASIKKRGTEGVCTGSKFGGPTCKPGSKRYNLAKVFKGMAKKKK